MRRLICGCGYLGSQVARRWAAAGDTVYAITRNPQRRALWSGRGWNTLVADITQPASLANLPPVDTVLFAVGYDRQAGYDVQDVFVAGLQNLLDALPVLPACWVSISTTGVYGQSAGEWVDESSECQPATATGRACLQAEQLLRRQPWPGRCVVLRLAGLYGPGRVPHERPLQRGEPLAVDADGWLNLVHVDDAAAVVVAISDQVDRGTVGEANRAGASDTGASDMLIYNVSDGQPVRRAAFYGYWAKLHGWPSPRFVPPDPSSTAGQRALSNKRVDSRRLRREVCLSWKYPGYREGLAAIAADGDDSGAEP